MVRTFTHKEPSSFGTLGSQFSLSWKPIRNFKLALRWVPGQTQSLSSLGPKVRIQTHGSPKNASWEVHLRAFVLMGHSKRAIGTVRIKRWNTCCPHLGNSQGYVSLESSHWSSGTICAGVPSSWIVPRCTSCFVYVIEIVGTDLPQNEQWHLVPLTSA